MNSSAILRSSTNPSQNASVVLPTNGQPGSLGFSGSVWIEVSAPRGCPHRMERFFLMQDAQVLHRRTPLNWSRQMGDDDSSDRCTVQYQEKGISPRFFCATLVDDAWPPHPVHSLVRMAPSRAFALEGFRLIFLYPRVKDLHVTVPHRAKLAALSSALVGSGANNMVWGAFALAFVRARLMRRLPMATFHQSFFCDASFEVDHPSNMLVG